MRQYQWSNYSVLQNDWTFLKDNSLNATFTMTYSNKNLQAFQIVEDQLFSELAVSKTILNKKGVISLAVSDIFNLQDPNISTRYQNQFSSSARDVDNRYIQLGFRYKFGNTRLQSNQRSITTDERDRLNKENN